LLPVSSPESGTKVVPLVATPEMILPMIGVTGKHPDGHEKVTPPLPRERRRERVG
jgi:hypothetical protein